MTGLGQGGGSYPQNIGPADGRPRSFGVGRPFGAQGGQSTASATCPARRRVPALTATIAARASARTFVAESEARLGPVTLTSITGTLYNRYRSISGLTHTVDNALTTYEDTSYRSFSQEFRGLTKFDGPVNFLVGLYYQNSTDELYNHTNFRADISYNPATDQLVTYVKEADLKGRAYSAFGQMVWITARRFRGGCAGAAQDHRNETFTA